MLRTASSLPLLQGFRHWASTRPVSRPSRQSATGPPGSYPDRTHTGKRRRAYEHEDQLPRTHSHSSRPAGRTPDLVQIVLQILLELLDATAHPPRRTLVRLDLLPGLPTSHFEISNGLPDDFSSPIATPPEPTVPVDRTNTATDDPTPSLHPHLQGLHRYYESVRQRAPRRYSRPHGFSRLGDSLSPPAKPERAVSGRAFSTFRAEAADRAHVASMPDTAWPISGHPPGSSRDHLRHPGFDVI